jgi:hypothetical protein
MGFLDRFTKKKPEPVPLRLRAGSFTVSSSGNVIIGTLPSSFPVSTMNEIAAQVLRSFREAAEEQSPLDELIIHYPNLKITARNLQGGAIIFLAPKTPLTPPDQS